MALIKCKDCERDVSTLATNCPNCGRPVDEQQLLFPEKQRVPCPDGNCTGILDEDGKCGICKKPADWRDCDKDPNVSSTINPEKSDFKEPCSAKGALIALVIIIGCLLIVLVFTRDKNIEKPKPSSVVTPVGQNTQIAAEQTAREKSECAASIVSMKAEYAKLMSEKKYWDAAFLIQPCAKLLQDKSLRALSDDADAKAYMQVIDNPTTPIREKIHFIEMLVNNYPDKAESYNSMLPAMRRNVDQIEQQEAIEQRKRAATEQREQAIEQQKIAAQKKREGVRIGMTPEDVRASSWGKPESVNRTTSTYGKREQWVYGSGSYLYFEDGILTTIQN